MNAPVTTPVAAHIKRINPYKVSPDAMAPLVALETQIAESGLEHSLIELVKMRASQINGCAFCLHMLLDRGGVADQVGGPHRDLSP